MGSQLDVLTVMLYHGLDGSEFDFRSMDASLHARFAAEVYPAGQRGDADRNELDGVPKRRLFTHRANSYALKTHDGLEAIAALALNETIEFLESVMESVIASGPALAPNGDLRQTTVWISLVGHSLGGLVAKAVAKLLVFRTKETSGDLEMEVGPVQSSDKVATDCAFAEGLWAWDILPERFQECKGRVRFRLLSYLTVSTPHLGMRSTNPLLHFALWLAGKTGREISLSDAKNVGAPLIEKLADRDGPWARAVDLFRFRTLIGVVKDDFVAFETATASQSNPHTTELETLPEGFMVLSYEGFDVDASTKNENSTVAQTEVAGSKNSTAGDRRYLESAFSPSAPHMVSCTSKDVTATDSPPHILTDLPNPYFSPSYNPSNILPIADSLSALSLREFVSVKSFRRVAVSLKVPGILDRFNVHALACGKQVSGVSNAALATAQHSAEWLASLLLTDFLAPTPSP